MRDVVDPDQMNTYSAVFDDNKIKLLNIRLILYFAGLTLLFEVIFLLVDLIICWIYDPGTIQAVARTVLIVGTSGLLLLVLSRHQKNHEPGIRDSFLIVVISWLLLGISGALPFWISGTFDHFTNAWFESISGFTTTGSSILTNIEGVPRGILFWRSETHWIGGMGIILMMLAVFPHYRVNGMQLFGAESSAVIFEKLKPRLIESVKRLWIIYLLLTIVEAFLLYWGGMDGLDSLCHAFGTVATGGFSTQNNSIAAFSPYIQYIVLIFMLLAGVNFVLHYYLLHGKFRLFFRNQELRLYLFLIFTATVVVASLLIGHNHYPIEQAIRESIFQVVSVITCTGFTTGNYESYAHPAIAILLMLMVIGGCAGSTAGGIKVVRILVLFKRIRIQIQKMVHPRMVKRISYNDTIIENNLQQSILSYILIYILTLGVSTFILLVLGNDIRTAFGSATTCLGGVGPGLGLAGPIGNFAELTSATKIFLTILMILGRLEILTVFVLFTPDFRKL